MSPDELNLISRRARSQTMRWLLLVAIDLHRPQETVSTTLRPIIQAVYADATDLEIQRELDYLEERDLVSLRTDPLGQVRINLERYGMDIVQYTVDCEPGIARPRPGT